MFKLIMKRSCICIVRGGGGISDEGVQPLKQDGFQVTKKEMNIYSI